MTSGTLGGNLTDIALSEYEIFKLSVEWTVPSITFLIDNFQGKNHIQLVRNHNKSIFENMSSHAQIRWIDLSEDQKKQVLRMRNAASARKSRQKRRAEEDKIEKLHDAIESRMDDLESNVEALIRHAKKSSGKREHGTVKHEQVLQGDTGSSSTRPGNWTSSHHSGSSSDVRKHERRKPSSKSKSSSSKAYSAQHYGIEDDRPTWFGDTF